MKGLVFDIETTNAFDQVRKTPEDLDLSVVGVYSYPKDQYSAYTQETLPELWDLLRDIDTLIGFNNNHFDTPLLNKYAPMDLKKEFASIDLLESIRRSLGRRVRLDWVAKGTLDSSKSGDGLQAIKLWNQGEREKVIQYCLDDVAITKKLFDYALKNKELLYNDLGSVHTVPIDTSEWKHDDMLEGSMVGLF